MDAPTALVILLSSNLDKILMTMILFFSRKWSATSEIFPPTTTTLTPLFATDSMNYMNVII
jgi:hypothetical protein